MVAGLRKIDLDDVTLEVLTNWREFKCKMTKMIMFQLDLAIPYLNQLFAVLLNDRLRLWMFQGFLYVSHRLGHTDKSVT